MRLAAVIELYAGGPGSGCTGPNCGRPELGKWDGKSQTQQTYQDQNGHYLPERVAIHDQLIQKYEHRPGYGDPVIKLVAGGTASGKTTVQKREYADLRHPAIVNMDMPRADLPEFSQVVGTNKAGLLQEEASDIRDKILMSALGHSNDIALDAVGSPGLANKLDALEKAGYKIQVSYIHTPVDMSVAAAAHRAQTATDPADRRVIPEEVTRASHEKARGALPLLMKPGREVKVYGQFGKELLYHRTADGDVKVKNDAALEDMRNAKGEKTIPDIF